MAVVEGTDGGEARTASESAARRWPKATDTEPGAVPAGHHWRGIAMRSIGLGIVVLWFAYRESWTLVAIAVTAMVVFAVASAVSPRAAHLLDEAALRVGTGAAALIATVGVGIVDVVVSLPGRALSTIRRRNPLTGAVGTPTSTWRVRDLADQDRADRPWAPDVPGRIPPRRAGGPRVSRLVLGLAALVVLDAVAGSVLPQPQVPSWVQRTTRILGEVEPDVPGFPDASPATRAGGPALAGAAWGETCLQEADALQYDYVQFLVRSIRDTNGSCVEVRDGERSGYVPEGATKEVWVLGGSAAFGEGQRDEHTIASELARASEAAGQPVRVRNFAVPGFTSYQEALLLEQLLARHPVPDLVVLYDGVNDVAAQVASPTNQATWLPFVLGRSSTPGGTRSLWTRWRDASLVVQGWDWLVGQPAGATAAQEQPGPDEVAELTLGTYGRGVVLAQRIGAEHNVPVLAFFQATALAADDEITRKVVAGLPDHIVDLSGALDDTPATYIDAVHTNEDGARRVADAIGAHAAGTVLDRAGS